ncbi:MAG: SDR family oxidoreductase [Acetobacteraceae bacterium]|nr:SDR family oxidoreductase [Acetobacteraceae bacterium]MSP29892.1 SDR family oxidoreductase [Acetobacteraceae bacterium]
MFTPDTLAGKRILITGGGTGLGKSLGRCFLELGARLIICGRRLEVLEATAEEFRRETGGSVQTLRCDIRDAGQVEVLFDTIWRAGRLDALVNNAAGNFISATQNLSARAFDSVVNVTFRGTAFCTMEAGRRWISDGLPGTVLSILSTSVFTGRAFTMPSAASKAAVLAMTRSLAVEWGPKGIRLLGVAPGMFPTEGAWERLRPEGTQATGEEQKIPLRRVGQHGEIANLCAFLLSDMATYMNGDIITIDGGRWLQEGGAANKALFDWSDEDWAAFRDRLKRRGV